MLCVVGAHGGSSRVVGPAIWVNGMSVDILVDIPVAKAEIWTWM